MNENKNDICIETRNIHYIMKGHIVLDNISFAVKTGEYLGIIGPNGGGKTTLIKIILGLLSPDSGEVEIFGQKIESFDKRYLLGYIPQRVAQAEFYFPATVEEIVRSGRTARAGLFRRYSRADKDAIERAMEITEVADIRGRLIGNLSGGERQRVYIARALAGEPQVLILDEPTVGVDVASQERFYNFLSHLNHDLGITVIFISHDLGVIADQAGSILCLNHRLFCHGHPENFIKEEFLEEVYGKKMRSVLHRH